MTSTLSAPNRTAVGLVSADSHVIEPVELWADVLPPDYWGATPGTFSQRPGGFDSKARLDEMAEDGVSAEVLYPSLALRLFSLDSPEDQRECFRLYNDWLADYIRAGPERLLGVGLISVYDMDLAVQEAARCHRAGLRGIQVWQSPHPDLPFASSHYDPLWETAAELHLPVSLHILSGHDYSVDIYNQGSDLAAAGLALYRRSINLKWLAAADALLELILSGALDRHREMRLVLVENEIAWAPFLVDQLDYYYARLREKAPVPQSRPPSECFQDQVRATFFRDPNAAMAIGALGGDCFMWSNDYPHGNSTWPNSREVVRTHLAALDDDRYQKAVVGNVCALYGIDPPSVAEEG